MSAGFSWKWRAITPFVPRSKHRLIRRRHTWTKRPLDKKSSKNEAKPYTINQWALRTAHRRKEKVGWAQWEAGRPIGRPPCPWAPPPQVFDVATPHWMVKSVPEVTYWFHGRGEGGSPLYIWGEGLHFYHLISHITTSTQHSSKQERCS